MPLRERLKEGFVTLKTVEGGVFAAAGLVLVVTSYIGLVKAVAALAPVIGVGLIGFGGYKFFVTRNG